MHRLPVGRAILLLLVTTLTWWWWSSRPLRYPDGVLVAESPVQEDISPKALPDRNGFHLTPVARYHLRARVLGTKRYHAGLQSHLVPVDVAIGWGRMSDQAALDQLRLTMGNRFFFYEWEGAPPIPKDELMRSAANNHVIAANPAVASAVSWLRVGQLVEMAGWLVDADGPENFHWPTSRRRDDTGNGACELFYVESLKTLDPATLASRPAGPIAARP
jgi:hypothetical protein